MSDDETITAALETLVEPSVEKTVLDGIDRHRRKRRHRRNVTQTVAVAAGVVVLGAVGAIAAGLAQSDRSEVVDAGPATVATAPGPTDPAGTLPSVATDFGGGGPTQTASLGPAIAGFADGDVLYWGGETPDDLLGEGVSSGSIISVGSGRSVPLASKPFDEPVTGPRAVSAGGDTALLVAKTCLTFEQVDEPRVCEPDRLLGSVFDRDSGEWNKVTFDDAPGDGINSAISLDATSNGTVLVSSMQEPSNMVIVELDSQDVTSVPEPPLLTPDSDDEIPTVDVCVTDSAIVLAERTAALGAALGTGDTPARVHLYPLPMTQDGRWRTLTEPPGIFSPVTTCSTTGALISNSVGVDFGLVWLDAGTEAWTEVAPAGGPPLPYSVRIGQGPRVLLFDGTAANPGLVFDPTDARLRTVSGEPASFDCDSGQCITTAGTAVVGATRTDSSAPPETSLFWFQP